MKILRKLLLIILFVLCLFLVSCDMMDKVGEVYEDWVALIWGLEKQGSIMKIIKWVREVAHNMWSLSDDEYRYEKEYRLIYAMHMVEYRRMFFSYIDQTIKEIVKELNKEENK